jgi:hypothetical protein
MTWLASYANAARRGNLRRADVSPLTRTGIPRSLPLNGSHLATRSGQDTAFAHSPSLAAEDPMIRRFHLMPVYALAIAAALGFGIKEATASTTQKPALSCSLSTCGQYCTDLGYDYGKCTAYGCQCYIRMCGNVPC